MIKICIQFIVMFIFILLLSIVYINHEYHNNIDIDLRRGVYPIVVNNNIKSLGVCYYFQTIDSKIPVAIMFNKKLIQEFGINLDMVLLHEIGHCTYSQDHAPIAYRKDGCLKYIMSPFFNSFTGSDYCFQKHKEEYIQQLKDNLF